MTSEDSSERGIHSRASELGGSAGAKSTHPPTLVKKRRRRIYIGVGAGVLALVVVGIVSASRSKTEIDPSKLATAEKGDIARSVVATGKIQPLTKVEVKSKASGIVEKLDADYGDTVREGQVLVELDKETLQAQVREARAQLLSAQAALQRTRVEAQGPDLPFLKSAAERARRLYEQGLISTNVLEDAQKEYELALNKQRAAQSNVSVNEAEVARARATLERADTDLRNSTIVSPMSGLVLSRDVEVGDAVSSILIMGSQATLVMTLGDVTSVYVLGKVDEADIGKVYMGQPARITVESFKDKKFVGKVTKISPFGKEKDNVTTFEVRVSIDNPGGELKANMSANAEIIREEMKDVLLVPDSAILYDKDRKTSVEVPDPKGENGRRKVAVKVGISNGVKAEVMEGLKPGDKVVLQ
ncbi:MAG: efflux RND transporter periplasmic adaptor subunit [Acidobacteria bacterium]|nr:MAG: efflux RND transporter periplasmic adaptor subunit [Acidobacteriota bacterium]